MVALFGLAILIIVSIFNLAVLSYLWQWYITPVFHLPVPELHYLYGLALIVSYFTSAGQKTGEKSMSDIIAESLARGVTILVLGWLVHVMF
ncbi:MAG TPA: hypothetical protein VFM18_18910 [Methanosarcina sp.]|nr:hypothetical protein [Methanosarcina sp.]